MKKQLNESGIVNELRGGSAFFRGATPQPKASTENSETPVRPYDSTVRTDGTNGSTPAQRPTKRHPFEIYADQLARLQKLKAKALLEGESLSMSEMVRDAIDHYLAERE